MSSSCAPGLCQNVRAAFEQLIRHRERIRRAVLELGESRIEPLVRCVVGPEPTPHLTFYDFDDTAP